MPAILLLDDSLTIVMSVSRILKNGGYDVDTATNGQEGINKINAGLKPNIILTDINMPVMDGIEFIKAARRAMPTRFTPILVLTTESAAKKRDEARSAGASGWLTKPTEANALLTALKQLLPAK